MSLHNDKNDEVLCVCFGIKTTEVVDFFQRPDASVDKLISETKLGTKCTACLLNLDVELENLKVAKVLEVKSEGNIVSKPLWGAAPKCMVDSGFFLNYQGIETTLRVSNFENKFFKNSKEKLVPFFWRLKIYTDMGNLIARKKGKLEINSSLDLPINDFAKDNESGWFWLELKPMQRGLFGSTRPQFSLTQENWISTVHTQPHMSSCKLKSVIVKSDGEKFNASVHVINSDQFKKNEIRLVLTEVSSPKKSVSTSATVSLCRNGSKMVDLDKIIEFSKLNSGYYILSVHSSQFCRKHIIINQKKGEMSIDHFPDRR